ncbi:hypothetical protein AX774_g3221 [Zancudomyces culisetae]|uniref:Uncharacterized protein n=1 Tax=Zancudomyces culisetae TaxID=1213189 RepID=A0A1R1PQP6_ZANCU|nr:hypothetical protein AX774_g3221 [Zancudomyces culisetae]|eukprot:OMH83274.1 hypothetical protein AX774_g3221 [Zancudomyces culisetae]
MNAKPMVENVISEPMIKPPERAMGENFLETPTLMSPQHLSKPKDSPFSLSSSLSLSPLPLNLQSPQQLSAHSPLKTQQKQKKPQLQAKSQKKTQKPGQRQKPSQETQPSQKQQQNPLLLPHSQMQNLSKQKTTQEQDLDNGFDADPKQWRTPTQRNKQISNIQESGQVGDKGDSTEHGNLDKKDTEINKNQGKDREKAQDNVGDKEKEQEKEKDKDKDKEKDKDKDKDKEKENEGEEKEKIKGRDGSSDKNKDKDKDKNLDQSHNINYSGHNNSNSNSHSYGYGHGHSHSQTRGSSIFPQSIFGPEERLSRDRLTPVTKKKEYWPLIKSKKDKTGNLKPLAVKLRNDFL